MQPSNLCKALQASLLCLLASKTLAQAVSASTHEVVTATVNLGAIQTLGCFSNAGSLQKDNTDVFQTSGACQPICGNQNHSVMAITGGTTCYCGDLIPPLDKEVDMTKCDTPCPGFGEQTCGGIGYFQVYLTGLTGDVEYSPNSTSTSSSSSSSSSASKVPATVVVTTSATSESSVSGGGPSKVGIAVGVVVGVIAVAALAGGAIFYMKQKRRREIEEEHKAQAAINSFVGSRASDTKSDARLDPSMASSYRRESIGSIADERDFSRRILQVRNPDRGSMNSLA